MVLEPLCFATKTHLETSATMVLMTMAMELLMDWIQMAMEMPTALVMTMMAMDSSMRTQMAGIPMAMEWMMVGSMPMVLIQLPPVETMEATETQITMAL